MIPFVVLLIVRNYDRYQYTNLRFTLRDELSEIDTARQNMPQVSRPCTTKHSHSSAYPVLQSERMTHYASCGG